MEARHFYKVEVNFERYDLVLHEYYLDKTIAFQVAVNEEEAIRLAISHVKFEFCSFDSEAPNNEFVKNFECKILK